VLAAGYVVDGVRAPTVNLASALMAALPKSGVARVASVDVVTTPTANGRAALAKIGVIEEVSSFTTSYPCAFHPTGGRFTPRTG